MRNRFDRQLEELNANMIQMGNDISKAIERAIDALQTLDVEKAKNAVEADEGINDIERKIENLCFKLLLSQQPVARDLRVISAALKMVTDMERRSVPYSENGYRDYLYGSKEHRSLCGKRQEKGGKSHRT